VGEHSIGSCGELKKGGFIEGVQSVEYMTVSGIKKGVKNPCSRR